MSRKAAVTFVLLFSLTGVHAGTYSGGDGSAEDPFQIATPNDFVELKDTSEDWGKNFIMVNDVNLSGYEVYEIGSAVYSPRDWFQGTFDGNSHKITGFSAENWSYEIYSMGLFGSVGPTGVIKNLGMEDVNVIENEYSRSGTLVGSNGGQVINCWITGKISTSGKKSFLGGLVYGNGGQILNCYSQIEINLVSGTSENDPGGGAGGLALWNGGVLKDSHAQTYITAGDYCTDTGGLVGHNYNDGSIIASYADGTITCGSYSKQIGGLVGENEGEILFCYTDDVNIVCCPYSYEIGGLVGRNDFEEGIINNCYSTINLSLSADIESVGGLVGLNGAIISNSFALGNIAAGQNVGGLVGRNFEMVYNSFSKGSVIGDTYVGGLIGFNEGGASYCFWDIETGGPNNGVGTPLSTAEMMTL